MVDLAGLGEQLAATAEAVLPAWVERSVDRIYRAWSGRPPPDDVIHAAHDAGTRAQADIGLRLKALLTQDIDDQRDTPLSILRTAVRYPTTVLRDAGVSEVVRDGYDEATFPADVYGLTPASFGDIDPALADPGLAWGAAKAFEHRRRHA